MYDPDDGFEKRLPECRFAVRACVCGLILAWALTSTLKWADRMPAHLSWAGILVGPATLFVAIGSCFASALWLLHRWWMAYLPVLLLCCAAMLALMWAERGCSIFWTTRGWIWKTRIGVGKRGTGPVHRPTLGRAIPLGTTRIPLLAVTGFCSGCAGATRSDHGLQATVIAPCRSLSLPPTRQDRSQSLLFAPMNPQASLLFAPFRSRRVGSPKDHPSKHLQRIDSLPGRRDACGLWIIRGAF